MVKFNNALFGEPSTREFNALQQSEIIADYEPSTSSVVNAYIDEAFLGVGTAAMDISSYEVENAKGVALTDETYKSSTYYRPTVDFYEGMTDEAAKILAENQDDVDRRGFIIGHAKTYQDVLGFSAGFTAGIFEPKNFAIGAATTLIGGPIANRVVGASRLAKASMRYGNYKVRAGKGAVEGLVASAIAEPSNQESAKVMQQDYGMADSLMNVALSTVLGSGLNVLPAYVSDKLTMRRAKKLDVDTKELLLQEYDTATSQLAEGQKIDVSAVEKIVDGSVAKKPIAEKADRVEAFVRYTETPEFKSKFAGSKVVDAEGAPLRVYHGTKFTGEELDSNLRKSAPVYRQGTYFAIDPKLANEFATRGDAEGGNVRPVYVKLENPYISDANDFRMKFAGVDKAEITSQLKAQGFDGVIITRGSDMKNAEVIAYSPDQIIPAFGDGDVNALSRQIDTDNMKVISNSVMQAQEPLNSTAIDLEAAAMADKIQETDVDRLARAEEEISAMVEQGLLDNEDLAALEMLNQLTPENYMSAFDAAYICMTRG